MIRVVKLSRRDFLRIAGASAAALALEAFSRHVTRAAPGEAVLSPSVFLSIDGSGQVTVWLHRAEMGQGVLTSVPMIVAEELDADWSRVRVEQALADPKYGSMVTGGSRSIRRGWQELRAAGAAARHMLVAAAAAEWHVSPESCQTDQGYVRHLPSGRAAPYGELAARAAALPVPSRPALKGSEQFRLLGRRLPRLDVPAKTNGRAVFGTDVRLPGMLRAVLARPPTLAARVADVDAREALALPGVRTVVRVESGVAVVADTTYAALLGRDALRVRWEQGPHAALDTAQLHSALEAAAAKPGPAARDDGDARATLRRGARRLEARYRLPFLPHLTMEPMNCTVRPMERGCEIWAPTQAPDRLREAVARSQGLAPERVTVHTTLLGGGFGRRLESDFAVEAAAVARAAGAPVQVLWTRDDDIRHDFYRPASAHHLEAALSAEGALVAWLHRVAMAPRDPEPDPGGVDGRAVEGADRFPYQVANVRVEYARCETPVPVGAWRSVANSQNALAAECFLDELAHAAGQDPYGFRRALLSRAPRHLRVLDLAAKTAGWGDPLPRGRARGIAVHECFGTVVAEVAEVEVGSDGHLRVPRVVCAVDCGFAVNPDTVEAQMEGSVVFALGALLRGEITLERGGIVQGSFRDCQPLRLSETPRVETRIVPSADAPGGVGEPGVPPLAPAVLNALFAATGVRIRRLPLRPRDLAASLGRGSRP